MFIKVSSKPNCRFSRHYSYIHEIDRAVIGWNRDSGSNNWLSDSMTMYVLCVCKLAAARASDTVCSVDSRFTASCRPGSVVQPNYTNLKCTHASRRTRKAVNEHEQQITHQQVDDDVHTRAVCLHAVMYSAQGAHVKQMNFIRITGGGMTLLTLALSVPTRVNVFGVAGWLLHNETIKFNIAFDSNHADRKSFTVWNRRILSICKRKIH